MPGENEDLEQLEEEDPGTDSQVESEQDIFELSDEEFMKQEAPTSEAASQETQEEEQAEGETEGDAEASEDGDEDASEDEGAQDEDASEAKAGEAKQEKNEVPAEDAAPDYKKLYEGLMTPFKANGKTFTPQSPEEIVRLAQMGVNYTQKMQALKPHLAMLRTLESNGLLDPGKINMMIDLDKKNPKAIQQLLRDSNIDPMDMDMSEDPKYVPGNHQISEKEMEFHEVVSDVSLSDVGRDTITLIHSTWDQTSKQAVFAEPDLLKIMAEQRANGIYDRISSEIDRLKTLGVMPMGKPFIHAYKEVGDRLQQEGKLNPAALGKAPAAQTPVGAVPLPKQVLETRAATPRKPVSNGDKAKAASASPKTSVKPARVPFDPFSMSDAEIMAIQTPPLR